MPTRRDARPREAGRGGIADAGALRAWMSGRWSWLVVLALPALDLVVPGGRVVGGLGVRAVWLSVAVPLLLGQWAGSTSRIERRWSVRFGGAIVAALVFVVAAQRLQQLAGWGGAGTGLLPSIVLAAGALAVGTALGVAMRRRLRAVELILLEAAVAMIATDIAIMRTPALTDLIIDLRAGERWMAGRAVYPSTPLLIPPSDHRLLPFLYPPFTLPVFAFLDRLPQIVTALLWTGGSLIAGLAALRLFGLGWRWLPVFALWPPFFQGLHSGNVVIPTLTLLAFGPRFGATLPVGASFKLQSGIPSLWLLTERRWGEIALGVAFLLGVAIVTLPLVGLERWPEWIAGLQVFQQSSVDLIGYALPRYLPYPVFLAIAAAAVALALTRRGRTGLAALAVAAVVASPSLYDHGFLLLVPALLFLDARLLWLSIGLGSSLGGDGWWLLPPLAAAGLFSLSLRQDPADTASLHPLDGADGAWPWAVEEAAAGRPVGSPSRRAALGAASGWRSSRRLRPTSPRCPPSPRRTRDGDGPGV